jgi:hypothetical protein
VEAIVMPKYIHLTPTEIRTIRVSYNAGRAEFLTRAMCTRQSLYRALAGDRVLAMTRAALLHACASVSDDQEGTRPAA